LTLTEIDGVATDELFASPGRKASATPGSEFVIDLPAIEKAPEPLPRRVGSRPHRPRPGRLDGRDG
jgi:hypothetical protein